MWECDLKRELQANGEMKQFFENCDIHDPFDPREAFYGGRTNVRKMYHRSKGDERILYADVCSLYPWVESFFLVVSSLNN